MNQYLRRQAVKITTPIFFGYIAIGIPFGLMIVNSGYPWWLAPLMSLTMYAGAGQYIAVGLFASGAALHEILVTELFVNIRHIVYGLSLITKFKNTGSWKPYIIFALTDETYAVQTGTELPKGAEPGPFFGLISLLDQTYWVVGTVIGALAYNVLEHYNLAQYLTGVDFALNSLFVVILCSQLLKSHDVVPPFVGLVSGVAALVLCRMQWMSATNIVLASIGMGVAAIVVLRAPAFYRQQGEAVHSAVFVSVVAAAAGLVALLVVPSVLRGGTVVQPQIAAKEALPLGMAICAALISALIIFGERLFPFALFSKKDPPALVRFIERYIPSMVMAVLIVYSLKDVNVAQPVVAIPYAAGIGATVVLQLVCRNSMVSIFGSTILFMVLSRML